MYCGYCGKEFDNTSSFCPYCGSKVNKDEVLTPVKAKKSFNAIKIIVPLFIAAILAGLVFLGIKLFGNDKKHLEVCEDFMKAYANFDIDKMEDYLCYDLKDAWADGVKQMMKEADMDLYDIEDGYDIEVSSYKDVIPEIFEALQEEFEYDLDGDIEYNLISSEKLSKKGIQKLIENLTDDFDDFGADFEDLVEADKIKEAYEVEFEVDVDSDDDEYDFTEDFIIHAVKYDGEWKILISPPYPIVEID